LKYTILDIIHELGLNVSNAEKIKSRHDYNQYIINYNSVISFSNIFQSAVILETSYTTLSFPTSILPVTNYIGRMMVDEAPDMLTTYNLIPFSMKVQDIERTLADKIFAICDYYLQNHTDRHSRHIYDIYMLLPLVPLNEDFCDLLAKVRTERATSPVCPSASPDCNISSLLQYIVDNRIYEKDYNNLTLKLLSERVDYNTAISAIYKIIQSNIF